MAARKERKINYADRHWTEKPLDQMKERDWRIFKEDFNIACKGTRRLFFFFFSTSVQPGKQG